MTTAVPDTITSDVLRRFEVARDSGDDNAKTVPAEKLTLAYLNASIESIRDPGVRDQLKAIQFNAMESDGEFTDLERQVMNWLIEEVKDGGNLQMLMAGEVTDIVGTRIEETPNDEQYEERRQTGTVLLDAIHSGKHDQKDLKPIIEEFRRLSTDGDGFTSDDARLIRDMVTSLA
jgi:hypothetical protein